jgi:hypothetical protein
LLQIFTRAVQTRFHCSNFGFDGAGDFFERKILVFGKKQNLAL